MKAMKTVSVAAITSLITTAVFMFILHGSCGEECHKGHHGKECHATCEKGGNDGHCDHHSGASCSHHGCEKSKCSKKSCDKSSCHGEKKCSHGKECGHSCDKSKCSKEGGKKCAGEGSKTCNKKMEGESTKEITVEVEVEEAH